MFMTASEEHSLQLQQSDRQREYARQSDMYPYSSATQDCSILVTYAQVQAESKC
jgi:hypothetical protein